MQSLFDVWFWLMTRACSTEESDGKGEPKQKKVRVKIDNSNINQLLGLQKTTTE